MADMNVGKVVGGYDHRYNAFEMNQAEAEEVQIAEIAEEVEKPQAPEGNMVRRYEKTIGRFSALLGRATDVRCDMKDSLLKRVGSAYNTQQSALERKVWGGAFFQGLGGAAGFAEAALDDGPWKNVFQIGSKLFPQVGNVVSATCDSTQLVGQKELQFANAAITSGDTSLNMLQQTMQTYNAAMQRLDELKSRAHGG